MIKTRYALAGLTLVGVGNWAYNKLAGIFNFAKLDGDNSVLYMFGAAFLLEKFTSPFTFLYKITEASYLTCKAAQRLQRSMTHSRISELEDILDRIISNRTQQTKEGSLFLDQIYKNLKAGKPLGRLDAIELVRYQNPIEDRPISDIAQELNQNRKARFAEAFYDLRKMCDFWSITPDPDRERNARNIIRTTLIFTPFLISHGCREDKNQASSQPPTPTPIEQNASWLNYRTDWAQNHGQKNQVGPQK